MDWPQTKIDRSDTPRCDLKPRCLCKEAPGYMFVTNSPSNIGISKFPVRRISLRLLETVSDTMVIELCCCVSGICTAVFTIFASLPSKAHCTNWWGSD